MKKHWIFDWSGTVVDDMGLVISATSYVLGQYDKPAMDRETFRREFCLPYEKFYLKHLPGINKEEIEAHFRHGFDISEVKVTVLPHAREFLDF
jgi:phosphoglycolate phosphatase